MSVKKAFHKLVDELNLAGPLKVELHDLIDKEKKVKPVEDKPVETDVAAAPAPEGE